MSEKTSKRLQEHADAAAYCLNHRSGIPLPPERLRDFVDSWTQGDLDCVQLDILTDMVRSRLK
jgi:hypothetical protein